MLKGIYSAAEGMMSEMLKADVVADNLANLNTPGYKTAAVTFQNFSETLLNRIENGELAQPLGTYAHGSGVMATVYQFSQGDIVQTANPLDLALEGDGFFVVEQKTTGEVAYTRAGNFTRDAEGQLVTMNGDTVMGEGGPIEIPKGVRKIQITSTGDVLLDGTASGRLKVVQFEDNHHLTRLGASLYTSETPPRGETKDVTVRQGALEHGNANVISELVSNISGMRHYEIMQKSIQFQNETMGKAVNEVGKA